jgi:hypothetical protein
MISYKDAVKQYREMMDKDIAEASDFRQKCASLCMALAAERACFYLQIELTLRDELLCDALERRIYSCLSISNTAIVSYDRTGLC